MKLRSAYTLLLLLLTAGWSFGQKESQGDVIDRIIGVVGGEIVLLSDIETELIQMQMQGVDPDGNSRCEIMEDVLFQKLLLNQAKIDSIVVTEGEIQSQIESRLEYYLSMFGSIEAFEKEYGKSIAQWKSEFHDPIKESLLVQQMQYKLESRAEATPRDVMAYFESIPPDSLPLISEEVRYSQIVYQPEATSEEKEQLRILADSIRLEVIKGNLSIAIASLRYSDDPGSKYKGGCYDNVRRGMFVPEFETAVYNTDVGDITPVFESPFGYHFARVKEKRADTFSACHVLFSPKVTDEDLIKGERMLDSLAQVIRLDSISFDKAAMRYSTEEETRNQGGKVPNFREGGLKHGVDDLERDIFLVLSKLAVGEVSNPIMRETPSGTPYFVIFRVDSRSDAPIANMREDYLLFKRKAEDKMRREALEKWVNRKLKSTYVRFDESYDECRFRFPWLAGDLSESQ